MKEDNHIFWRDEILRSALGWRDRATSHIAESALAMHPGQMVAAGYSASKAVRPVPRCKQRARKRKDYRQLVTRNTSADPEIRIGDRRR